MPPAAHRGVSEGNRVVANHALCRSVTGPSKAGRAWLQPSQWSRQ
jgi:hypothetical protein